MQKGFIQIPILVLILIGTAVVGGGGYYAVKEIAKSDPIEVVQNEAVNNIATEETTTPTSTEPSTEPEQAEVLEDDGTEEKEVEATEQVSVESRPVNTPGNTAPVNTNPVVATKPVQTNVPKQYPLDQSTRSICGMSDDVDEFSTHIENILELCEQAENDTFDNEAEFDDVIEEIKDEWDDWETERRMAELEAELKEAQQQAKSENDDEDDVQQHEQNTVEETEPEVEDDPYSDYNFSYSYKHVYPDPDWIKRFVVSNTSRDLRITKAVFTISNSDAEKYNSITDPSQPPRVQFCKQQCTGYTLEQISDNTFSYTGSKSSGIPISTGYLYVELPIPAYPEGWITNINIPIDDWSIWDKTTNKPVKID